MKLVICIILNSFMCYLLGIIHTEIKYDEEGGNKDATEY